MEDEDIAAAMGFSSFGETKKRKFDHTNSPKSKIESSGANSMPLGVRPKHPREEASTPSDNLEPDPKDDTIDSIEPQPASTNRKAKQKQVVPSGLAGFLARGQQLPEKPPTITMDSHIAASLDQAASVAPVARAAPAAPRSNEGSFEVSFGGPPITKAELAALREGVRNEQGDIAYFLPSFVEDPWAKLDT